MTAGPGRRARAHLLIAGRVQGVAYRQSTVDEARRLGLAGWVRNLPDGRVEAVAEGDRAQVEALVAWCRRGPRLARVDAVAVIWEEPRGDAGPFDIAW
jgi:acylphosphatase